MKSMISRYDVCVSPYDDALTQTTIEVDAVGEEEALETVRKVFGTLISVNSIQAHKERRQKPVTMWIRIGRHFNLVRE